MNKTLNNHVTSMTTPALSSRTIPRSVQTVARLNAALRNAVPTIPVRHLVTKSSGEKKKKKTRNTFKQYKLKDAEQFALCDAMRYGRSIN